MELKITKGMAQRLQGRFGKYDFQVGVLDDAPYKEPLEIDPATGTKPVTSSYAGGPIRKKSRKDSGLTVAQVSAANREHLGFNYLTEPFKKRGTDIIKFTEAFFKLAFGRSEKRRAENLLQAVVRNPILRGEYGKNGTATRRAKGFVRPMIDTAQLFKALKAVCNVGGRK